MEQQRDRHVCPICGARVSTQEQQRRDTLCERCTDAWEREVDCAW